MQQTLNAAFVQTVLPKRPQTAHKGSFGTLGLLCGSRHYRGAALLCAEAALRCGVGMVQMASIEAVCAAAAVRLPGCVFLPLVEDDTGGIAAGSAAALLAQKPSAIAAGCGLGNTPATAQLVETLLQRAACPLLLDADALNALAGHLAFGGSNETAVHLQHLLQRAAVPVVLTPHIGEMARLCGQSTEAVQQNQLATAHDFAQTYHCTVVLKSHRTVIATPGKDILLLDEGGNPGLAKAGSGDVLAGTIASLLAQGLPAHHAAAAGAWLHAQAGKAAAQRLGTAGMLPQDLPPLLAEVLKGLHPPA